MKPSCYHMIHYLRFGAKLVPFTWFGFPFWNLIPSRVFYIEGLIYFSILHLRQVLFYRYMINLSCSISSKLCTHSSNFSSTCMWKIIILLFHKFHFVNSILCGHFCFFRDAGEEALLNTLWQKYTNELDKVIMSIGSFVGYFSWHLAMVMQKFKYKLDKVVIMLIICL